MLCITRNVSEERRTFLTLFLIRKQVLVLTIFPSGSSSLKSSPLSFDCSVIAFSIVDRYSLHESTYNERQYRVAANLVIGSFYLTNYLIILVLG